MNRLQSRSRCMTLMIVMLVAAVVLLVCAWFATAAMIAAAAGIVGLCSLRECRICHQFASLIRTDQYGAVCPTCQRMILEGRQQELLERRAK
ncbi:hypothetical protein BHAP_0786 [Bifidobacterium hapali]|uniref:Uncharacterized protein n=1 Tax=Bifidobacterium hapali TaxID=1630172 RepID=A0A261G0G1_9BIFI|nr:hypothetical protein [Bifidobacterium hapali]OZG64932.1 hypothetical protein BHAP_0786 [Bifidobacterium hapali]